MTERLSQEHYWNNRMMSTFLDIRTKMGNAVTPDVRPTVQMYLQDKLTMRVLRQATQQLLVSDQAYRLNTPIFQSSDQPGSLADSHGPLESPIPSFHTDTVVTRQEFDALVSFGQDLDVSNIHNLLISILMVNPGFAKELGSFTALDQLAHTKPHSNHIGYELHDRGELILTFWGKKINLGNSSAGVMEVNPWTDTVVRMRDKPDQLPMAVMPRWQPIHHFTVQAGRAHAGSPRLTLFSHQDWARQSYQLPFEGSAGTIVVYDDLMINPQETFTTLAGISDQQDEGQYLVFVGAGHFSEFERKHRAQLLRIARFKQEDFVVDEPSGMFAIVARKDSHSSTLNLEDEE